MCKRRRLNDGTESGSIEKDQDMAQTLLSLKAATIPGSPKGCEPLCHPQAFENMTSRKSKKRSSAVASRGKLSMVDYDEVAAISEDEHEESFVTKKRFNRKIGSVANYRRLLNNDKSSRPKTGVALQMPMLFRSSWTPNNAICNGIPIYASPMTNVLVANKKSGEDSLLSFPLGRPLPPPPRLPKLRPGQVVLP